MKQWSNNMVTAQTTKFIKQIQSDMRFKGWKYERRIASAGEELTWTKEGEDYSIVLTGWHGTRGWGTQRLLHNYMVVTRMYRTLEDHVITDLDKDTDLKGDCNLTPTAAAKYQTILDQIRTKIITKIA